MPQWSKGYRVVRLPVPAAWDGRTLRDLDCRARFGVSVLAVEPRDKPGHTFEVLDPDRRLEAGDTFGHRGADRRRLDLRAHGPPLDGRKESRLTERALVA